MKPQIEQVYYKPGFNAETEQITERSIKYEINILQLFIVLNKPMTALSVKKLYSAIKELEDPARLTTSSKEPEENLPRLETVKFPVLEEVITEVDDNNFDSMLINQITQYLAYFEDVNMLFHQLKK